MLRGSVVCFEAQWFVSRLIGLFSELGECDSSLSDFIPELSGLLRGSIVCFRSSVDVLQ